MEQTLVDILQQMRNDNATRDQMMAQQTAQLQAQQQTIANLTEQLTQSVQSRSRGDIIQHAEPVHLAVARQLTSKYTFTNMRRIAKYYGATQHGAVHDNAVRIAMRAQTSKLLQHIRDDTDGHASWALPQ